MVADTVEGLGAQVERNQRHVGAPHGMVVAAVDVWRQCVFAGVPTWAVTAVVTEGDRLGQGHVEPEGASDRGGDLGNLEGVGQPGALMVVGEDEHLGLAGQAPEGAGVQDAVAIAFEARAPCVGSLVDGTFARARRPEWPARDSDAALDVFAVLAAQQRSRTAACPRVGVGEGDAAICMSVHRRRPPLCTLAQLGHLLRVPNNSGGPVGIAR